MSTLTPVEVIKILKERKRLNVAAEKFPFHVMSRTLYKYYGKANIKPALIHLVETKQIKMGTTANDVYFNVPISGRHREFEDEMLIKCNFKSL